MNNLTSALSVFPFGMLILADAGHDRFCCKASKKGGLNFYVGRHGSEPLLNEFRKEFPEIKLGTVNGAGNTLGTRIITELRASLMKALEHRKE